MSFFPIASLPRMATIVEVGPRDGLQSSTYTLNAEQKIAWIEALVAAGHRRLEIGAFVSHKRVPAMADSAEVFARIPRSPGVRYAALVPNERGMEAALAAQVDEVAVFTAASETFNQKNTHASIRETLDKFKSVIALAKAESIPVRGYISTVFGCPYEGSITPAKVWPVLEELLALGCFEISLGDTTGVANPLQVRRFLEEALRRAPVKKLAVHFHDTYGRALTNCWEALQQGVSVFDASGGGLGGCPYAPGANGNVATEDLDALFKTLNIQTGLKSIELQKASRLLASWLPDPLPSRVAAAQCP
jgi:hydroxymethylglutaryl-CoA lyase